MKEFRSEQPMPYCQCEAPLIDVEHDDGCRRCGRPVDFTPHSTRVPLASEHVWASRLAQIREQELDLRRQRAEAVFGALADGVPHRVIADALGVSRQAVGDYIGRYRDTRRRNG